MAIDTEQDMQDQVPSLEDTRPEMLRESYKGASEGRAMFSRGTSMGAIAAGIGALIGGAGAQDRFKSRESKLAGKQNTGFHWQGVKAWAGAAGIVGAVLGMYTASRDARAAIAQFHEMKRYGNGAHDKIAALQDELREQLKAQKGEESHRKLTEYNPEWEEEGVDKKAKDDVDTVVEKENATPDDVDKGDEQQKETATVSSGSGWQEEFNKVKPKNPEKIEGYPDSKVLAGQVSRELAVQAGEEVQAAAGI